MKKLLLLVLTHALALSLNAATVQCGAKTKAGTQCKNKTETQFCKVHDPNGTKCGVPTKKGEPCKNKVAKAGTHCHLHQTK